MAKAVGSSINVANLNYGLQKSINLNAISVVGKNNKVNQTFLPYEQPLPERIEFDIQDPIESFTGRTEILEKLHNAIEQNKLTGKLTVLSQTRVITGMGGVGKSETVRKYIHKYKHLYGHTLWITAGSFSEAKSSFSRIAALCHINHEGIEATPDKRREVIDAIYDYVCKKPCLIVFDNAEVLGSGNGEEGIRPFLPESIKSWWEKPAIIATSRYREWKHVAIIELSGLTEKECYDLLISQLKFEDSDENREFANQITSLCEGLPLVVQQVIAIIRDETEERKAVAQPGYAMEDFLKEFNGGGKDYTDVPPEDSPVGASVYKVFRMAFRKIEAKEHGHLALRFLNTMALLSPDSIPTKLFLSLCEPKPEEEKAVPRTLLILHKYNLMTSFKSFYKVHRVVQRVALCSTKNAYTEGDATFLAEDILATMVPRFEGYLQNLPSNTPEIYEVLQNGNHVTKHLLRYEEVFLKPSNTKFVKLQAEKLNVHGKHNDAEQLYQKLVTSYVAPQSIAVELKGGLAEAYFHQGKYSSSIEVYEDVLRLQEYLLEPNDQHILSTKHNLALVYQQQGKYKEALEVLEDVLKRREDTLGPTDPLTLVTKFNIGNVYLYKKKYEKAGSIYQDVLEHQEAILGPSHPNTLKTRHNLGNVFLNQGRYDKAIEIFEGVIKEREATLGSNHPDSLQAKTSLAIVFNSVVRYENAVKLYTEVLKSQENIHGRDHANTLNTKFNLANTIQSQGNYQKAIELYEDVLKIRTDTLGPHNLATLQTKSNLATALMRDGKNDEAIELYEEVLTYEETQIGPNHPSTLRNKGNLAIVFKRLEKFEKAAEILEDILKNQIATIGSKHADVVRITVNLANVFLNQGRYDKAASFYEDALETAENMSGPDHPDVFLIKSNLATVFQKQEKFQEAVEIHEDVLKKRESMLGANHPDTIKTKNNLAIVLETQGKYERAGELYADVQQYQETVLGPQHPGTLETKESLEYIFKQQGALLV